jgi:S-adenosylmethionine-dependent methyltransferase
MTTIQNKIEKIVKNILFRVPPNLAKNQIQIDENSLEKIKKSIEQNFYIGWKQKKNYAEKEYEYDFNEHLINRLEKDRMRIIPWLNNVRQLKNSNILEIGCGTGSSTVALAEQGARVNAVDIDESALAVAKDRCKILGLQSVFSSINATDVYKKFSDQRFDFIIFFACLEHMTHNERMTAMKNTWNMLETNDLLIVIDTPNRLWYYDTHTSELPFFHWLPDELAFKYSSFSRRNNFRELYREYNKDSKQHFLRRGRGVSFHEFDIAIRSTKDLEIISSLSTFEKKDIFKLSFSERRYKSFLSHVCPNIHEGFFDPYLNLIIKKD